MIEYEIKCVVKDSDGDIVKIGYWNQKTESVKVITREIAIERIERGEARYYTYNKEKAMVTVYAEDFLRSTSDETVYNNLDNLRSCKVRQ